MAVSRVDAVPLVSKHIRSQKQDKSISEALKAPPFHRLAVSSQRGAQGLVIES